jgi:murein DD-endopeptidase MepM/ murein hydrolase activator NlpD
VEITRKSIGVMDAGLKRSASATNFTNSSRRRTLVLLAIALLLVNHKQATNIVSSGLKKLHLGESAFTGFTARQKLPPKKGEIIAGYTVTSPFGPRNVADCPTCSRDHMGIDVAMDVGTPLHTIGKAGTSTTVKCLQDTGGTGGTYSSQTSPDFPGLSFESLHLSKCNPGEYPAGTVFGFSGSAGTGPHLHAQIRDRKRMNNGYNGKYPPERGFVYWVIKGKAPTSDNLTE